MEELKNELGETENIEKYLNVKQLSKRYFTVKCIENSESLDLSFLDIDSMKKDFA